MPLGIAADARPERCTALAGPPERGRAIGVAELHTAAFGHRQGLLGPLRDRFPLGLRHQRKDQWSPHSPLVTAPGVACRRSFLHPCPRPAAPGRGRRRRGAVTECPDVVIVGAGAAGIAAARRLAGTGRSVLLVEALPRLGGRAWTARVSGLPLDLGCGWLHSADRNPLVPLAVAQGAEVDQSAAAWGMQFRNLGASTVVQNSGLGSLWSLL